jgi:hypothetical protein
MASAATRSNRFVKVTLRRKSPAVVGRGKRVVHSYGADADCSAAELSTIPDHHLGNGRPRDEKAPHEAGPGFRSHLTINISAEL